MKTKILTLILAVTIAIFFAGNVIAAQGGEKGSPKSVTASGAMTGELIALNDRYVTIAYKVEGDDKVDHQMLLPYSDDLTFNHMKGLSDMKIGDTFTVSYEDVSEDDGNGNVKFNRKAKAVSFVSPAPPKPPEPIE
jgi:hypothetical protein